jgi:hypothetical protein
MTDISPSPCPLPSRVRITKGEREKNPFYFPLYERGKMKIRDRLSRI